MRLTKFEKELQKTYRKNVIECLRLFASPEEQLEFQRNVPIAHVTAELFCNWSYGAFSPDFPEQEWYRRAFSKVELRAMTEVDQVCESVLHKLPEGLPGIEEFVKTPEAAELAAAATKALSVFDLDQPAPAGN